MENLNFNTIETTRREDMVIGTLMRNVYLWMTLALAITGLTALVAARSEAMMTLVLGTKWMFYGLMIAEIVLVMIISARLNKLSFAGATALFALYSVLNGLTMSVIFFAFTLSSIASTFFITAGMFGCMAVYGSITKKDLSGVGRFCMMTLIGLIIAMLVNLFMRNSMFDLIVSGIGVLLFTALTAYDSQKIRQMLAQADEVNDTTQKIALMGSLSLYLDFINLFLYLLRFFGSSRD